MGVNHVCFPTSTTFWENQLPKEMRCNLYIAECYASACSNTNDNTAIPATNTTFNTPLQFSSPVLSFLTVIVRSSRFHVFNGKYFIIFLILKVVQVHYKILGIFFLKKIIRISSLDIVTRGFWGCHFSSLALLSPHGHYTKNDKVYIQHGHSPILSSVWGRPH